MELLTHIYREQFSALKIIQVRPWGSLFKMAQQEFYTAYNTPGQSSFLDPIKAQQTTVALKALGEAAL